MGPGQGAVLLALLWLSYLTGLSVSTSEQCQAPNWNDSAGPNPFPQRRGKVTLVAFHKGYCGYCVHQAGRLYELKNELISEGFEDIDMIIINGGEPRSSSRVDNLINASPLQVIQDTPDHVLYNQVFGANKDDFLVFDRCSQAAIYIPSPWSDLDKSVTKSVLKAVSYGRHTCYCALDYAPRSLDDMMQGDDPGITFYQSHDMNRNMLQCAPSDSYCLVFQRTLTNYSRRSRNQRRPVGRRAFRRMLNSMRQRYENSRSETPTGVLTHRRNQGQEVEGRRSIGYGGRGFGGGRRPGLGRRIHNHIRNSRSQEMGRPQRRIAGSV